jgi:hypothetical protein
MLSKGIITMDFDPNLKICYDRVLSRDSHPTNAILHSMREDALLKGTGAPNARVAFHDIDPTAVISAPHMAVIGAKTWPDGSTLKCRFLGGSPTQQAKVAAKAKIWETYANMQIEFVTTTDEQVRIAFLPGQGSWSAVGTDALDLSAFPKTEPTMNFGWLEDDTDDMVRSFTSMRAIRSGKRLTTGKNGPMSFTRPTTASGRLPQFSTL